MSNINSFREKIILDTQLKPVSNTVYNPLAKYYKGLQLAEKFLSKQALLNVERDDFFSLPALTEDYIKLFEHTKISIHSLNHYKNQSINLLNLMSDSDTNTTKSFASLLTVAKLINHIKTTNETMIILTPSSGNKAIAFRSAVARAITLGLVPKEKLRTFSIIPKRSQEKFRENILYQDKTLRELNPFFVFSGDEPEDVKQIAYSFYQKNAPTLINKGIRLWYSLHINNYKIADTIRAFFDYEMFSFEENNTLFKDRWHTQAVSSAFGLIGYNLGCEVLAQQNLLSKADFPGYMLVQHMATPDMVLHLYNQSFSRSHCPKYTYSEQENLFVQHENPHFPYYTYDLDEILEPTFYTHKPATAGFMTGLINTYGGTGIVVSLAECIQKYPLIRRMLQEAGIYLPADFRKVQEWSSIMALTGVLNAIDRNLIPNEKLINLHASGFYTKNETTHTATLDLIEIDKSNAIEILEKRLYQTI